MDTAIINIRTQINIKEQLQKVAEELGLTVSALLNGLIKQVIRTKRVEFESKAETPSPYLINMLKQSEAEYASGDYYSFKNPKEAIEFLDKALN